MSYANLIWWISYTTLAIILQAFVQGVDFLIPAFIVTMQEKSLKQFIWVSAFYILLQEGMGTLAFGGIFLWYLSAVFFYILGQWLFEVESLAFILLLSIALAITHYFLIILLTGLQDLTMDRQMLIDHCVYQALFTPVLWSFAKFTRRGVLHAA